jgi:predicted transcriptional regulator
MPQAPERNTMTTETERASPEVALAQHAATQIAVAYINRGGATVEISKVFSTIYPDVLGALRTGVAPAEPEPARDPAVPIKKSVTNDYIVCLEDGAKFKSLKRHLMTHYGLTPEDYRKKWGLPKDYPMVAPNYAATRSALAKTMGLGRKPGARGVRGRPAKKAA